MENISPYHVTKPIVVRNNEMIRYFLKMSIATVLTIVSYQGRWWLPFVIFPGYILNVPNFGHPRVAMLSMAKVHVMRGTFYLLAGGYVIAQAIIFQNHIGSWYGWIVGTLLSWGVAGMCAAKLEPWLFWREPISDLYFSMHKRHAKRGVPQPAAEPSDDGSVESLPERSLADRAEEAPSSLLQRIRRLFPRSLEEAAKTGSESGVRRYLRRNAAQEAKDRAFLAAIRGYHLGIARVLFAHGADVNARDKDGNSALHYVCGGPSKTHYSTVQWLVENGSEVDASNNDGLTPLLEAASWYDYRLAAYLLASGADPNMLTPDGSPLHRACQSGFMYAQHIFDKYGGNIVSLLLEHGADPNLPDEFESKTPLHAAVDFTHKSDSVKNCYLGVVSLLLAYGADPSVRDKEGRTPLDYAEKHSHPQISEILRKTASSSNSAMQDQNDKPERESHEDIFVAEFEEEAVLEWIKNKLDPLEYIECGLCGAVRTDTRVLIGTLENLYDQCTQETNWDDDIYHDRMGLCVALLKQIAEHEPPFESSNERERWIRKNIDRVCQSDYTHGFPGLGSDVYTDYMLMKFSKTVLFDDPGCDCFKNLKTNCTGELFEIEVEEI